MMNIILLVVSFSFNFDIKTKNHNNLETKQEVTFH